MTRPLEWMAAVRDHPQRPPASQRYVLWSLAVRMDWQTGCGFASTTQLMSDADCGERTIRNATGWARKAALLVQTRRGHRISADRVIASEWKLALPEPESQPARTAGLGAKPTGTDSRPNRQIGATQPARGDAPSRTRSSRPSPSASASRARAGSARAARSEGQNLGVDQKTIGWCDFCRSGAHETCPRWATSRVDSDVCTCWCGHGICPGCEADRHGECVDRNYCRCRVCGQAVSLQCSEVDDCRRCPGVLADGETWCMCFCHDHNWPSTGAPPRPATCISCGGKCALLMPPDGDPGHPQCQVCLDEEFMYMRRLTVEEVIAEGLVGDVIGLGIYKPSDFPADVLASVGAANRNQLPGG